MFACALLALAPAASAQRVPVLAELFTSEGCESCPPADALLMKLDLSQPIGGVQIIVLSEHVDYWNQLGWRDPYSLPAFGRRQAEYALKLHAESYTPQVVIDGREQMNGSDAKTIDAAIARAASRAKLPVRIVEARREGDEVAVQLSIDPHPSRAAVWLAVADETARSTVTRGENAGRTLDHVAVVRSLSKAGALSKSAKFEKTVRLPVDRSAARIVVFVQESGGVLGAASASIR